MSGWSCDCCCYLSTFKSAADCCQKGRPQETEEVCSQHQWLNELQWDVQTVASQSAPLQSQDVVTACHSNVICVNVTPGSHSGIQEWSAVRET